MVFGYLPIDVSVVGLGLDWKRTIITVIIVTLG